MYLLMFWVELVKYFLLIHYSLKSVKEEMICFAAASVLKGGRTARAVLKLPLSWKCTV
jgi:hypothetical protein